MQDHQHTQTLKPNPPTSIIPMAYDEAPKPAVDRIRLVGKWVGTLEAGEDFVFNLENSYVFCSFFFGAKRKGMILFSILKLGNMTRLLL